jgi:hypothetical protein
VRQLLKISPFALGLVMGVPPMVYGGPVTYTSDSTLADFTSGVAYGQFIVGPSGDRTAPYTPTTANVDAGLRIYGFGVGAVIVRFASAVSTIRVFPNLDHVGASYDGYQYAINGSNDGVAYTPLFDVLTVTGGSGPFTLGSFTGTAPTQVNNVLTPGAGPGGTIGYIPDFSFGAAYKYYRFDSSTFANNSANTEPEFSAVGTLGGGDPTPEPTTFALFGAGLAALLLIRRRSMAN